MKKLFNLLKESQHMDYRRLNIGEEDLDDTKMTNEEKRAFVEAVASYRKIGEAIYHNGNLMEAYQNIKKIVETAHKLTLQETGDWFDKVTVSRHMKSMNESFKIFTNTIKEVSTLQQRLESSYDEIGEILGKYYEIKEGNEFGAERARAIAAGEDTFQVGDKTFKVTDVDSEDKENAKDFVGENMKLSQLINKKSVNQARKYELKVAKTGKYEIRYIKNDDGSKTYSIFLDGLEFGNQYDGEGGVFPNDSRISIKNIEKLLNKFRNSIKESVNEAKVFVHNEKTGEKYEVLSGKGKGDLLIAMKALEKSAPSHMKYSIKESVNEGKYDADLDKIEAAVKNASSFMNVGSELKKAGIKYDFSTSMIPMYRIKVSGNTIAIVNKKYAAGAEREVKDIAIGLMEGKNLVKEVKKPKFGDTVHLKSQNKTGMVYSVKGNEVVIKTVSGLVKGKLSDAEIVMDEGNEFGAERARAIAAGEDTFTVSGKTYKVTDVDPQDKENAKDFVGEMKLSNLILKKKVNEANVKLSDLLKSVVDGSTSRVGSTKVDKKTAEKLLKLYKVGDVAMQNKFDKMTADKVISAFKPFMENKKVTNEVAPEGWEKTVKAMKDEPGIDNPWALAWWMKGQGFKSHKK